MSTIPPLKLATPFKDKLPSDLYFRIAEVPANTSYPAHQHPWGEFVYSYNGMIEVQMKEAHYLVPPQYGIWLPANQMHQGFSHVTAMHCSFYVSAPLTDKLPSQPCTLSITPLVRSILDFLRQRSPLPQPTEEDLRLMAVLVDQLAIATSAGSYLPMSEDAALGALLRKLEANPADDRSLAELALLVNVSERTLIRRCQRDLGMPFSEWRQRLKVVKSLPLLLDGSTVEHISLDLGYNSSSAFISMFKRLMSMTPDEYRKQHL
ncbi:helix-turn-helix transcriptional regulator [Leeia sp. TBRC 13508]|uniref:Helix-turn-helix transcriptional regulator n=1 Tax=Leeia speluncae TaxID=2884804 RepID=A0ABS8D5W5_9NEIS|nr:helix-turn-helix transcriptional regulator [Leeia speluncae]MCB6183522.1 helix-turn-helix transcriptional regulator [Leeia speluncae]